MNATKIQSKTDHIEEYQGRLSSGKTNTIYVADNKNLTIKLLDGALWDGEGISKTSILLQDNEGLIRLIGCDATNDIGNVAKPESGKRPILHVKDSKGADYDIENINPKEGGFAGVRIETTGSKKPNVRLHNIVSSFTGGEGFYDGESTDEKTAVGTSINSRLMASHCDWDGLQFGKTDYLEIDYATSHYCGLTSENHHDSGAQFAFCNGIFERSIIEFPTGKAFNFQGGDMLLKDGFVNGWGGNEKWCAYGKAQGKVKFVNYYFNPIDNNQLGFKWADGMQFEFENCYTSKPLMTEKGGKRVVQEIPGLTVGDFNTELMYKTWGYYGGNNSPQPPTPEPEVIEIDSKDLEKVAAFLSGKKGTYIVK